MSEPRTARFRIERLEERLAPSAFHGCRGGSGRGSHRGGSKHGGGSKCKGGSHKNGSHKGGSSRGGSKCKPVRCAPPPPVCDPKNQPCS